MKNLAILLIAALVASTCSATPFRTTDFSYYWSLDEINDYMRDLETRFPDITEFEEMGITAENRTIHGLRIVNEEMLRLRNDTMPLLLITGGASARDWISVMAAVNLIHELVEHYDDFFILVDYLEWFVVPVLNPDGYVFSMTEGNRDWIKNRRPNAGSDCVGVNIERNFNHMWEFDIDSSADPCSDVFRGPAATSEEETRLINYFILLTTRTQQAYVSIQAGIPGTWNGHIAFPFAYTNEAAPPNWEIKQLVAQDMSNVVLRQTGARYRTGSKFNLAGGASGTSTDFATVSSEMPYAFTIYTMPSGEFGWDVEEWRINPIVDQVFAALDDMARHLIFTPTDKN